MSTASDILDTVREDAGSYNREHAEMMFQMYKILLADGWHEMDESDRRNHIRRMFFAVYGAYNDAETMQVLNQVKQTEIYKFAEDEGLV